MHLSCKCCVGHCKHTSKHWNSARKWWDQLPLAFTLFPSCTVPSSQNGDKQAVKYQQFGHGREQLSMIQCDKRHCDLAKPFLRALCKEDQQHYSFNSHVECNSQLGFVPDQGISSRSEGNILFTRLFPKALIFSSVWTLTFLFVRRPKELREWEKLAPLSWSWMALGGRSEKGCRTLSRTPY